MRIPGALAIPEERRYPKHMTLEAIKQAIADLPEGDKILLVAWLTEQDAKAWDKQIEDDFSAGGAGSALLESWDAEIRGTKSVMLEDFLAQREGSSKPE